jgi:hypothetical protein
MARYSGREIRIWAFRMRISKLFDLNYRKINHYFPMQLFSMSLSQTIQLLFDELQPGYERMDHFFQSV